MRILHNLIASGKTKEALKVILKASEGHDADTYDEAILLSARLEKYLKNKRLGLIDSDLELRNIEYSILQLSNQVNINIKNKPIFHPKNRARILIGGLVLLVTVISVSIYFYEKTNARHGATIQNSKGSTDSLATYPNVQPDPNEHTKVKPSEKPSYQVRDSTGSHVPKKPSQIPASNHPAKTNDMPIQLPRPIESITEETEYITFKLILNAANQNYSIFIDGKPAELLDDSSPIIKTIRLKKSNQTHLIELKQQEITKCKKEHLLINNNQKITIPCTF